MTITNKQYQTTDLAFATCLISLDFQLLDIHKLDTNRVIFIFADSKPLQATIKAFWDNSLLVNPKKYFDTLKGLKTRIYSILQQNGK